jgi:hypothetical protein
VRPSASPDCTSATRSATGPRSGSSPTPSSRTRLPRASRKRWVASASTPWLLRMPRRLRPARVRRVRQRRARGADRGTCGYRAGASRCRRA